MDAILLICSGNHVCLCALFPGHPCTSGELRAASVMWSLPGLRRPSLRLVCATKYVSASLYTVHFSGCTTSLEKRDD